MTPAEAKRILAQKLKRGRPPAHVVKLRAEARRILHRLSPKKSRPPKRPQKKTRPDVHPHNQKLWIVCQEPDGEEPFKNDQDEIFFFDYQRACWAKEELKKNEVDSYLIYGEEALFIAGKPIKKDDFWTVCFGEDFLPFLTPEKKPNIFSDFDTARKFVITVRKYSQEVQKYIQVFLVGGNQARKLVGVPLIESKPPKPPRIKLAKRLLAIRRGKQRWSVSRDVLQRLPLEKQNDKFYYKGRRIIFRDTPILGGVYPGHGPREVIFVNRSSTELLYLYTKIRNKVDSRLVVSKGEVDILKKSFQEVVSLFSAGKQAERELEYVLKRMGAYQDKEIDLEIFLRGRVGVCRHRSLALGAILELFKEAKYLDGSISVDRNSYKGGYHVWVRYTSKSGEVYILDPMQSFFGTLEEASYQSWPYLRPEDIPEDVRNIPVGRPRKPKLLQCYRKGRADTRHASLLHSFNKCLTSLQRKGHDPISCLGCGQVGCSLKLSDGDVVKITTDIKEANLAYHLMSLGKLHPSLPRIKKVYRFPYPCNVSKPYRRDVGKVMWAIIRENLEDVNFVHSEIHLIVRDIVLLLSSVGDQSLEQIKKSYLWKTLVDKNKIRRPDLRYVEQILSLYHWCLQKNIVLTDMHNDNWGQRSDGTLVARDIGFTRLLGDYTGSIETLEQPVNAMLVGAKGKRRLRMA